MLDGWLLPTSVTGDFPGNLPPWVHMPTALHRCTHADTDLYRDDTYTPVHTHSHRHTCRHMHTQNIQHGQTCTDTQKQIHTRTKTHITHKTTPSHGHPCAQSSLESKNHSPAFSLTKFKNYRFMAFHFSELKIQPTVLRFRCICF